MKSTSDIQIYYRCQGDLSIFSGKNQGHSCSPNKQRSTCLKLKCIWYIFVRNDQMTIKFSAVEEACFLKCRRIYIANFAIFKIATFWSYHLHLHEKSWSFNFTKLRDFLVGSAHVRSQAVVHACAACMQRMQYAWGPRISIHVSKSARS